MIMNLVLPSILMVHWYYHIKKYQVHQRQSICSPKTKYLLFLLLIISQKANKLKQMKWINFLNWIHPSQQIKLSWTSLLSNIICVGEKKLYSLLSEKTKLKTGYLLNKFRIISLLMSIVQYFRTRVHYLGENWIKMLLRLKNESKID